MVLSQSLFQRQHRLQVSDSFSGDICLILEKGFGSAIQYLETLEPSYYLFKQPTCLSPLPVSVVVSTHTCKPSLSRKLLFAKSERNSDFQRVSLVSSFSSYLTKKDPSVCKLALGERGFHIHSHVSGPQEKPTTGCALPSPTQPQSHSFPSWAHPGWPQQTSFHSSLPTSGET